MYLRQMRIAIACLATVLFAAALLPAQTLTTGDVTGIIKDTSGAVIPSVEVTLKQQESNEVRTALTNADGRYRFSLLAPGNYTISAEIPGFKSNIQKLLVIVGQDQALDLTLSVTGVQQVVEVNAEATITQTENANMVTALSTTQLTTLPMNGGDLTTVAFTVPGVRMNVGGGNGNFNANGIPLTSILFTINGADVMDPYNNLNNSGASNNLLGANEIAEAAVILNAYSPQYGRMAAGQVNLVGKTGSNSFHGNANYNYNDALFNANPFFSNASATPRGRADANLFGASVGGPVLKNKLFFFSDIEGLHYALPKQSVVALPSPQLETYALAHVAASAVPIYQQAFALWNNAAGISRAVPVTNGTGQLQDRNNHLGCGTKTFTGTYVNGGTSGPQFGVDTPCALALGSSTSSVNTENLYIARIDWNKSAKHQFNWRYEYDWGLQATSTSAISHLFDSKSTQPQHAGQMTYTAIISPTLINTFTAQSSWYSAIFGVLDFPGTQAAIPVQLSLGDGGSNGGGFVSLGASFPTGRNVGQGQLIDDLSWSRGNHTFKAGVNYRMNKVTDSSLSSGTISGSYSLSDITDFTTGIVNGSKQGSTFKQSYPLLASAHIRVASLDFYASDEWNATKSVKLTYGIRFEHDKNPLCVDNCFSRFSADFLGNGFQAGSNVPYNQSIQQGLPEAYASYQSMIYEPRVGVVFTPFGNKKTVVRGGFGLFSNLPAATTVSSIFGNAPAKFTPTVTFGNLGLASSAGTSQAAAVASFNTFESSFNKGLTLSQIQAALGSISFAAPGFTQPQADFKPPQVFEWSLEIEHPLTSKDVLAVTYSGNHGRYEPINNSTLNDYITSTAKVPAGFLGLPNAQPDPRFAAVTQGTLIGYSNYDGLSVQLRHAMSYGFMGQFGYTWSHALQLGTIYDPKNFALGYGNAGLDTRHNLTADLIWVMPRLKNSLLDRTIGGWNVGGKLFAYTGRPFSVTNTQLLGQLAATNSGSILADVLDTTALGKNCTRAAVTTACLSQSQFAVTSASNLTPQTNWGNNGPNSFWAPGYFDVDSQITKTIKIAERARFELGANAYNLFNHSNFSTPSGTVTSATLGTITNTVADPVSIYGSGQSASNSGRILVLTGKFMF
jgi:Carboxypeptidase regulatory-like domain/TonB-dependent Receptor Plug Domain